MLTKLLFGLAAAGSLIVSAGGARAADDVAMADIVKQRQQDMRKIGEDSKLIAGLMKKGEFAAIAEPAQRIAKIAYEMPNKYLTDSPGSASKVTAKVFEDAPRFNYNVQAFGDAAGAVQQAALSGGNVPQAVAVLFNQCASCHDVFVKPN